MYLGRGSAGGVGYAPRAFVSDAHDPYERGIWRQLVDAANVAGVDRRHLPVRVVHRSGSGKTFSIVLVPELAHFQHIRAQTPSPAPQHGAFVNGCSDANFDIVPFVEHSSMALINPERRLEFDLDDYLDGGSGLPSRGDYHRLLTNARLSRMCGRTVVGPSLASASVVLEDIFWNWRLRLTSPGEMVQALILRLITLWRRADPARFARLLALQLRLGRVWSVFRPPRPPGQLMMASSHVTRGPDKTRMTQIPWSSAVSRLALT